MKYNCFTLRNPQLEKIRKVLRVFSSVLQRTCYGSISSRCQENYQDAAVKTEKDVSIHGYISSIFFLSVHYLDENGKEIKDEKDDSQRSKSSPDIVSCPSTTYARHPKKRLDLKENPISLLGTLMRRKVKTHRQFLVLAFRNK